jgi:SsrA-binding protein
MPDIASNKKARHEYEITDTLEVGILLGGTEVKSLRAGKVSFGEAYVIEKKGELFLMNAYINEYAQGNRFNHTPTQPRKLLAHKREIAKWAVAVERKGFTMVPLRMYFKGRWVKLQIGLGKGKDKRDKRQDKMKQEAKRDVARAMKMARR